MAVDVDDSDAENGLDANCDASNATPKTRSRRVLKKSMLTCRHCEEVFTSRLKMIEISTQVHDYDDFRGSGLAVKVVPCYRVVVSSKPNSCFPFRIYKLTVEHP